MIATRAAHSSRPGPGQPVIIMELFLMPCFIKRPLLWAPGTDPIRRWRVVCLPAMLWLGLC